MNYLSRIKNRLLNKNDIPEEIEEPIIQDDVSIQIATQRPVSYTHLTLPTICSV